MDCHLQPPLKKLWRQRQSKRGYLKQPCKRKSLWIKTGEEEKKELKIQRVYTMAGHAQLSNSEMVRCMKMEKSLNMYISMHWLLWLEWLLQWWDRAGRVSVRWLVKAHLHCPQPVTWALSSLCEEAALGHRYANIGTPVAAAWGRGLLPGSVPVIRKTTHLLSFLQRSAY